MPASPVSTASVLVPRSDSQTVCKDPNTYLDDSEKSSSKQDQIVMVFALVLVLLNALGQL